MTNPETGYEKAHRQAEQIFREVFSARGMNVREGRIRLCHAMLDTLFGGNVALCDAGVGLGKTYAYLVACILWQLQKPSPMQRPVVISTASITLQNAILEEYIPFLSDALIQNGYIQAPVCAVLRKGKERFVCDVRLLIRQKQITARGKRFRKRATALQEARQCLDLDRLPNLPRHERRLICVPSRCGRSCIAHMDCRYRQYLKASNGPSVTIQVCNHNYLLADAAHRKNGWTPLLKDYQALVIDEAYKLPETVRQMNTRRICSAELLAYEKLLTAGHCGLSAQKLRAVTREFLAPFAPPKTKAERAIPLKQTKAGTAALQHLDKAIGEILKQRPEAMPRGLRGKLSAVQQLAELREWANCNGYCIVGQSCECTKDNSFWRPVLFSMLRAVRRGDVDAVAVTRLSRFARKRSKLCKILAELQASDVTLITTDVSLRYQLYLYGLDCVIADCPKGRNRCAGIHTADA